MSEKKDDITFEDAMEKLDKIASQLEEGKLTLDESMSKFEEGMNLSKKCNNILNDAEKKITILLKTDDNKIDEKEFNTEDL